MKQQQQQRGGGHDVSFPSEYFSGTESGHYYPEGSASLGPYHGGGEGSFGYDLSPGSLAIPSSGIQTGGKKKKTTTKKTKKTMKKKGGFLPQVVNAAGSLFVPLALLAGRQFLVRLNEKKGMVEIKPTVSRKKSTR